MTPAPRYRLRALQAHLEARMLDGTVLAAPESLDPAHVRYLTGFTGSSSHLLVTPGEAVLITDFRYQEIASDLGQAGGFEVRIQDKDAVSTLADVIRKRGIRSLGFEAARVPVALFQAWQDALPEVALQDASDLVEELRCVKDEAEIAAIREAARLSGQALEAVLPTLRGRTERTVARDLERRMRDLGLDGPGFPTIVASGERGSMPHAEPGDRIIRDGDLVTIDFGGLSGGYRSDETVTVAVGEVEDRLKDMVRVVAEAQARAMASVRPGALAGSVDRTARQVIEEAGYGEFFGHGTGHGVGLDVHERPFARRDVAPEHDETLEPGMMLTVEPGIYIPGLGGVRLEDTLVVTETGHEVLTTVPKAERHV